MPTRVDRWGSVFPRSTFDRWCGVTLHFSARSSSVQCKALRLQSRWLADRCKGWLRDGVELRFAAASVPQGTLVMREAGGQPQRVVHGACAHTTTGLGVTVPPTRPFHVAVGSISIVVVRHLGPFPILLVGVRFREGATSQSRSGW